MKKPSSSATEFLLFHQKDLQSFHDVCRIVSKLVCNTDYEFPSISHSGFFFCCLFVFVVGRFLIILFSDGQNKNNLVFYSHSPHACLRTNDSHHPRIC